LTKFDDVQCQPLIKR